jgi:hypothetical protein
MSDCTIAYPSHNEGKSRAIAILSLERSMQVPSHRSSAAD